MILQSQNAYKIYQLKNLIKNDHLASRTYSKTKY